MSNASERKAREWALSSSAITQSINGFEQEVRIAVWQEDLSIISGPTLRVREVLPGEPSIDELMAETERLNVLNQKWKEMREKALLDRQALEVAIESHGLWVVKRISGKDTPPSYEIRISKPSWDELGVGDDRILLKKVRGLTGPEVFERVIDELKEYDLTGNVAKWVNRKREEILKEKS